MEPGTIATNADLRGEIYVFIGLVEHFSRFSASVLVLKDSAQNPRLWAKQDVDSDKVITSPEEWL